MPSKKSQSRTPLKEDEFMNAQTWLGKTHNKLGNKALKLGSKLSMTDGKHYSMDTLAGGLVGAAVGGTIAGTVAGPVMGPVAAVAGAAAGGHLATMMTGRHGDSIVDSVDELGAFYGQLDMRVRHNAQIRAGQSLLMFWLSIAMATFGVYLYQLLKRAKVLTYFKSHTVFDLNEWLGFVSQKTFTMRNEPGDKLLLHGTGILFDELQSGLQRCRFVEGAQRDKASCENKRITSPVANMPLACVYLPTDDGAGGGTCSPPTHWYTFYGDALMVNLDKTANSVFGMQVTPAGDDVSSAADAKFDWKQAFKNPILAGLYFVLLSLIVYLSSYATGRYYGGLVKGRCNDDKGCQKRMMRLSAQLQDTSQGTNKTAWNPLAAGTMGWVIAQSLLGMSFL
jgi:hypothetical protein